MTGYIHFSRLLIKIVLIQILQGSQCQLTPRTCGVKPESCPKLSKYRTYNGSCNNLENTEWGMPNTRYGRLLPAKYGKNGPDYPTMAQSGKPLPQARKVSFTVYPDVKIEDLNNTLLTMQYGEIITHDMSMARGISQTAHQTEKCCSKDGKLLRHSNDPDFCYPIMIPCDDPVYTKYNIRCFEFTRTDTDKKCGCGVPGQPAEQLSAVTHFLDLSLVYGQDTESNKKLRLFKGGKLKFEERKNQHWLPRDKNEADTCMVASKNEPCYLAGDTRVNQNPQLAVIQTILLREHNRIATVLSELNPKWNDEKIFQETRKICIAQHQNIVYYEWLPILLGKENVYKHGISYNTDNFVNDYNSSVNPSVLNEHATAAFRFFHSTIPGNIELYSRNQQCNEELRLSDWFNRPAIIERNKNTFDELTRSLSIQHRYAADEYHDKEITNNWLRLIGRKIGVDLKAISIQRNRDHGLASYNDLRKYCGLPKAKTFVDFLDTISEDNVNKLKSLYETPDDVDLSVGCSLEKLVHGARGGKVSLCIFIEQFYRTRVGDRFFFENSGDTGFSLPQLRELKKSCIAKIICENTDIKDIQHKGFMGISENNPVIPCSEIPSMNLSLWKEE